MTVKKRQNPVWTFFASVKLALFLLFTLAGTSIIGTVVPQHESHGVYVKLYGEATANVLEKLAIPDMYNSLWFQALLTLFALNLVVCSLERIPTVWRIIKQDNLRLKPERLAKMSPCHVLSIPQGSEETVDLMRSFLGSHGWKASQASDEDGTLLFAEKGAYTRFGVYVVHTSILVIFIGAMIGAFFGHKGMVRIIEGGSEKSMYELRTNRPIPLDFEVRCDGFDLEYYPNSGMPKEYRSRLVVIDKGQEVMRREIEVNSPLTYKGHTFYQSNYQAVDNDFVAKLKNTGTGETQIFPLRLNEQMSGKDNDQQFLFQILDINSGGEIPEMKVWFVNQGAPPSIFWMKLEGRVVVERPNANYEFYLGPRYYTGLQVTKDPGVWPVYIGCAMMLAGLYIAFFMSHRRLWVHVARDPRGMTTILFAGGANKNKVGFDKVFTDLTEGFARANTSKNI